MKLAKINALNSKTDCNTYKAEYLSVFGIRELKPAREEVKFKSVQ